MPKCIPFDADAWTHAQLDKIEAVSGSPPALPCFFRSLDDVGGDSKGGSSLLHNHDTDNGSQHDNVEPTGTCEASTVSTASATKRGIKQKPADETTCQDATKKTSRGRSPSQGDLTGEVSLSGPVVSKRVRILHQVPIEVSLG